MGDEYDEMMAEQERGLAEWIAYWESLTPEQQAREREMMDRYSAEQDGT